MIDMMNTETENAPVESETYITVKRTESCVGGSPCYERYDIRSVVREFSNKNDLESWLLLNGNNLANIRVYKAERMNFDLKLVFQ